MHVLKHITISTTVAKSVGESSSCMLQKLLEVVRCQRLIGYLFGLAGHLHIEMFYLNTWN